MPCYAYPLPNVWTVTSSHAETEMVELTLWNVVKTGMHKNIDREQ